MKFSRKFILLLTVATTVSIIVACNKKSDEVADPFSALDLPATPFNYASIALPAYLTAPGILPQINTPANNAITDNGATLGRVLFYDKNLSLNKTISCASCHNQANAFSDTIALSKGFLGGNTGRNSMSLINAIYYPNGRFFWDQRAATLEIQTLLPIQDHTEMGMNLDTLTKRLAATSHYPVLFKNTFGTTDIISDKIAKSLSQFIRSIVSFQSKYDAGRQTLTAGQTPVNTPFSNYSAAENRGKQIFFDPMLSSCAACHGTETFTAPPAATNNGIDLVNTDLGFGAVTGNAANNGQFKVTSLRNVELTPPYMHDGRFTTLEQVVEHYSTGVKANPNLSPQLKTPNGNPRLLNLSPQDKVALVAFLKTLTDKTVTADVKYSNPFK